MKTPIRSLVLASIVLAVFTVNAQPADHLLKAKDCTTATYAVLPDEELRSPYGPIGDILKANPELVARNAHTGNRTFRPAELFAGDVLCVPKGRLGWDVVASKQERWRVIIEVRFAGLSMVLALALLSAGFFIIRRLQRRPNG